MFCCGCIVSVLGGALLLYWGYLLTAFFLRHFTAVSYGHLGKYGAKKGAWAVVTGASDGIGKAYVMELAKAGFNVLLISRTLSKLEEVAKEAAAKYGVQTDVMSVDFVKADDKVFAEIEKKLDQIEVGILVNNVGINYDFPHSVLDAPAQLDDDIVHVNITTTNRMTRMALKQMVPRKRGGIVFLSSMAGRMANPHLAVYSGTKAYLDFYSKALSQEYNREGIVSVSVTPGLVVSNMSKARKSFLVCEPSVIASRSLGRLGKDIEISPYWVHAVITNAFIHLPLSVSLSYLKKMNLGARAAALRKIARNNKPKDN